MERLRQSAPGTAGNKNTAGKPNIAGAGTAAAAAAAAAAASAASAAAAARPTARFELDGMDLFSGAELGAPQLRSQQRPTPARPKPTPTRRPPQRTTAGGAGGAGAGAGAAGAAAASRKPMASATTTGRSPAPAAAAATHRARAPASAPSPMPTGPFRDTVVVVEGTNDVRAVTAAVRPLGGTMILKGSYNNKLGHYNVPSEVMVLVAAAVEKAPPGGSVIVLTDSDTAGRQLRSRQVHNNRDARYNKHVCVRVCVRK